jgi:DNA-binding SARP family transcriptional activator/ABC-type transport system substrate-binding protein/DNA-binding beta-propeller fold protein YncE
VEFRLLGPLELRGDRGRALALGGPKQRALLALLLLHANEVVSSEWLIEELWGEEPPQAAATALHGHVSRLRKLLSGNGELLITRAPGYVLDLEPGQLDLQRFESLREEARAARSHGDLTAASAKLREALSLWRGPPLADLAHERFVQLEAGRLEELRLAALEESVDVDLALGRHADLVPELERLVAEHPLREGFRVQLMLALYRSGRQAEALQVYHEARRELVEELGIEPSQRLRDLEQAILRQDESLAPPVGAGAPESRNEQARPRRKRLALVAIAAICAIGGVAAIVLLTTGLVGGRAAARYRPGTVLLDLKTGKQIAFLPPSQLDSPRFPRFAGGHFWLLNSSPRSFVELDPATGNTLHTFAPPDGMRATRTTTPFDVAGGALWVGAGDDLVKVDTLGEEVDRIDLDTIVGKPGAVQGVAVGGGLIWVGRDVDRGEVVAIDPNTHEIRHRFEDVVHHTDLAYGGRTVWAADGAGVDVIDLNTKNVSKVQDVEKTDLFFGVMSPGRAIASGGGFGWTTDSAKGLVYKIDRTGGTVAGPHTGRGATVANLHDGVLWVRSDEDDGTVTSVDGITGTKKKSYRFGHPVGAAVVGGGVLLAALDPKSNMRIGAVTGKVARLFVQQGAFEWGDEPARNWIPAAREISFATCAMLLNYPDKAAPAGAQLHPEVAAAMPKLSPDRRMYTFTVRRGYRFSPPSSNQPVTAETFRESIERALSWQLAVGFTPPSWDAPGAVAVKDIQGEQAFRDGNAQNISGLRVHGDRLSITLTKPSGSFLRRLADPAFCPVPIGTPKSPGAANRLLPGTGDYAVPSAGPYYVADWRKGHYILLKRNPDYDGPRPHALDAIVLREGVDASTAFDRVRHGDADGIVSSSTASVAWLDPLLAPGGLVASRYRKGSPNGDRYVAAGYAETGFIMLNAAHGPFADPSVRRAAALVINRTANALVWDNVPSDQLLPPGFPAFHDPHPYALGAPTPGALHRASALMRGRQFDVVMAIQTNCDVCMEQGRLVRAELRPIGLRVTLKAFANGPQAVSRGVKIDMADNGLGGGHLDGADFLDGVFFIAMPPSWVPSQLGRAVKRVGRLWGSERQAAAGALAHRLDVRDLPVIPYGNRMNGEFFAPSLGCRVFPPATGGVDLAALCLRDS